MEYPHIDTIWKRDMGTMPKGRIMVGNHANPAFAIIDRWLVTEKVDGTNIRVIYHKGPEGATVEFRGRTDNADLYPPLMAHLMLTFTLEKLGVAFTGEAVDAIIFGEGCGPKIGPSAKYTPTHKLYIFDVYVNGWWLERAGVEKIAASMGVEMVPLLGVMSTDQIVDMLKDSPLRGLHSVLTGREDAEGVVCTSEPMLLFRDKKPVRWKLKVADYKKLQEVPK